MNSHRASYLKTTLLALAASVVSFGLAAYDVAARWLSLPTVGATASGLGSLLHWLAVAVLASLGLLCLLVGTGGLFALHDDAKERGAAAPSPAAPSVR